MEHKKKWKREEKMAKWVSQNLSAALMGDNGMGDRARLGLGSKMHIFENSKNWYGQWNLPKSAREKTASLRGSLNFT